MHRKSMSVLVTGVCLVLGACGGNNGTVGEDISEPTIPSSHTIQLPTGSGPSVSDIRRSLTAIKVGDTEVLMSQVISGVSGGGGRMTVGPVLQNEDVIVRHIESHWNMQTDVVAEFDHISYGAWARGTPEPRNGGGWDYNYESVGDAYLTALDDARTPPAVMPMSGTATYLGQMTGFLKDHGVDGRIRHLTGDIEMTADFADAAMTVDLLSGSNRRITLAGDIQGNVFSGTNLVEFPDTMSIQALGATAQFSGGFYGDEATETGGVFEVVGGRTQDPGRIVGAFGGRKAE